MSDAQNHPVYSRVHHSALAKHVKKEVTVVGILRGEDQLELPGGGRVYVRGLGKPDLAEHAIEVRGTLLDERTLIVAAGTLPGFTDFGRGEFGIWPLTQTWTSITRLSKLGGKQSLSKHPPN